MTNTFFNMLSEDKKKKKFIAILKEKTRNQLTDKEISAILTSVSFYNQYRIIVYRDSHRFIDDVYKNDRDNCKVVFGKICHFAGRHTASEISAAAAVKAATNHKRGCIYILIPLHQNAESELQI